MCRVSPHARWTGDPPPGDTRSMHVGDVVGERFELLALAGSGGMGEVYRALDGEARKVLARRACSAMSSAQGGNNFYTQKQC